jgi:hypothetical protein
LWGSLGVAGGVDGVDGSVQLLVAGQCKGELVDGSAQREASSWGRWRQVQELWRAEGAAEREDLWKGELIRGCCWSMAGWWVKIGERERRWGAVLCGQKLPLLR